MRSETSVIRDVILPAGTTLRLRAATSDDASRAAVADEGPTLNCLDEPNNP